MAKYNPRLHYFSLLTAAATLVLIVAGGLVTSHDAGLSVPDWPLSFGQVMPEMVGGVFYEHGHRMIASTVGFLTIILCVWLWRADSRSWLRKLGVFALATVVFQGVLGGMTVLFRLPVWISVLHACFAQAFFCITVSIALFTSRGWIEGPTKMRLPRNTASLAVLSTGAVYLQLILGALLRHAGTVDGSKAVELVMPALAAHLLGALLVTISIVTLAIRLLWSGDERVNRLGYGFLVLLLVQISLGVGAYLARIDALGATGAGARVAVTTSHVAMGAALLASCLWLALSQAGQHKWQRRFAAKRLAEEAR